MLEYMRIEAGQGHEKGRQLLAKMYREKFGRSMPEIAVTERGKPYFIDDSAYFSISHTKRHVFCVLKDHPVGLDAEEMDRNVDLRLAEKILSPREKERYDRAADPQGALLRLWVLKEAAAKLSGDGLRGYPDHTQFNLNDDRLQEIDGCFVAMITEENYAF